MTAQVDKETLRNRMWEEYSRSQTPELREKLILEYAPLVKIIAGRLSMYLGRNVEYDDLCGYGVFGLIDAIDKYNYGKGVKFETYATLRIRGAILDQIRKMDWVPRTLRAKQKKLDEAYQKLESDLGRAPTDEELAAELGVSEDEFESIQAQTNMSSIISLDDYLEQGSEQRIDPEGSISGTSSYDHPEDVVFKEELKEKLAEAISELSDKEQKVIALYFYEEMTLKEISKVLDVSESRVCQINSKALKKLKEKLGKHMDLFTSLL